MSTVNIKPSANEIYVGQLVYDEVALKNVELPQTPKHDIPQQFSYVDFVPPAQA